MILHFCYNIYNTYIRNLFGCAIVWPPAVNPKASHINQKFVILSVCLIQARNPFSVKVHANSIQSKTLAKNRSRSQNQLLFSNIHFKMTPPLFLNMQIFSSHASISTLVLIIKCPGFRECLAVASLVFNKMLVLL